MKMEISLKLKTIKSMKKKLLLLAIMPFMIFCNNPQKIKTDERLVGTWKMLIVDNETKKNIDTLTVVYNNDGIVSYSSKGTYTYTDGKTKDYHIWTEKYYLTNKQTIITIGDDLVKAEAKYKFVTNNTLELIYKGNIQILTKIK